MTYTTQMDAARKEIVTPEMEIVAAKENMTVERLRELIAMGRAIIPANKNHLSLAPEGVGAGLRTKLNVNLGISKDCCNIDVEMEKVKHALALKAEAIMDLSCYGKTREFRRKLVELSPAMIGTVQNQAWPDLPAGSGTASSTNSTFRSKVSVMTTLVAVTLPVLLRVSVYLSESPGRTGSGTSICTRSRTGSWAYSRIATSSK